MAKFDLPELKRALEYVEKYGKLNELDVSFDPLQRLVLSYVEPMGGDRIQITLYPSDREKMAEVTTTKRL